MKGEQWTPEMRRKAAEAGREGARRRWSGHIPRTLLLAAYPIEVQKQVLELVEPYGVVSYWRNSEQKSHD